MRERESVRARGRGGHSIKLFILKEKITNHHVTYFIPSRELEFSEEVFLRHSLILFRVSTG